MIFTSYYVFIFHHIIILVISCGKLLEKPCSESILKERRTALLIALLMLQVTMKNQPFHPVLILFSRLAEGVLICLDLFRWEYNIISLSPGCSKMKIMIEFILFSFVSVLNIFFVECYFLELWALQVILFLRSDLQLRVCVRIIMCFFFKRKSTPYSRYTIHRISTIACFPFYTDIYYCARQLI